MSESGNPNVAVGAEPTIASKANSAVSFSDLEDMEESEARAKREAPAKKAKAEPKEKAEPKRKSEAKEIDEVDDEGEEEESKADGKKAKAVDEKTEGEEPKAKGEDEKPKAKTKVHKFKSAEGEELKVSGDFITTVPVDGKDEEVTLQELKSAYSGKVNWDRKYAELDREKKGHTQSVQQLNSTVEDLFKRSQENPEDAYDFLAELTGQDAVGLKEKLVRQQWEAMKHLAEMGEDEREEWFKDQVRGWRDRKYERREETEKKTKAEAEHAQKLRQAKEEYGISDEHYAEAERLARKHLGGETPTPEQVIYAERHITALDTIRSVVPHLEKHEKFGSIVNDIVQEMLRHPKLLGTDRLAAMLKETFPEEDRALSNLAKKAKRAADFDGDDAPRGRESGKKSEAILWDDL